MTRLLARWADNLFWLARYVERAENLARILDVQETFARDARGAHDWRAVLVINGDGEAFFARHPAADAASVLRFYLIDRANPTSILSDLFAARENARALRPLISTEMWTQLNMFYNRVAALRPHELAEERLTEICNMVKRGCDTHAGITAGTFYRDEAHAFYQLGAAIECADQTTRLLDAKFLNLEARGPGEADPAADAFYWMALLRSAAGYQAFRRRHPRGLAPEQVAAFLLCDACFPRSVACCLGQAQEQLTILRRRHGLRAAGGALQFLDEIGDNLDPRKVRAVIAQGELHQFNDFLQRGFSQLTELIGAVFFARAREPALASVQFSGQS